MPRYFFDIDDGEGLAKDGEGLVLPDDQAAQDEASRALVEMALGHVPGSVLRRNLTIWVRSENGEPLLQVTMSFAVKRLVNGM